MGAGEEGSTMRSRSPTEGHVSLHMNSDGRDDKLHFTGEEPGLRKCK